MGEILEKKSNLLNFSSLFQAHFPKLSVWNFSGEKIILSVIFFSPKKHFFKNISEKNNFSPEKVPN